MVKGEVKPIENEEQRQICFTKRRQSLFNKASEISILCGAMVGSIVFSTSGTPFSFGHPSIDDVAKRFLSSVISDGPSSSCARNDYSWAVPDTIQLLNMEYSELQQALVSEKEKKKMLQEATKKEMDEPMMQLLNTNISELSLEELQEFQKYLDAIHGVVEEKDTKMPETSQPQGLVPELPMEIAPDQQYKFGDEHNSANPMAFTAPSSSDIEFIDGLFEVDGPCLSGDLADVFGLGDFPDN
ncbi:hypothetical protein BDA96_02G083500 [Sorghum bicolor]|jgi:hypothetical protein|uniref:MADS-box domain-containing protein n=2 Tax=Sorghum bicolor TaxID=4558 RepID=A0A921RL60_SORBI|nr:agamous-like MADS-box protein AGL29 [Sorghum bicolor]EER96091.1 hypothetical protein SORBI_3002G080700 [Sorghum bicolor]KAG0542207.1 hypothetical protein BDA96_02G083500 [Sorghum bicolor]|eukprot:XP_002459570.1 agamous-like MADS-box protein AGL29 [Sorghum bicolor]